MTPFCLQISTHHQGNSNGWETWSATLTRGKLQSRSCWKRSSQKLSATTIHQKTVISKTRAGESFSKCTVNQSFQSTDVSEIHQSEVFKPSDSSEIRQSEPVLSEFIRSGAIHCKEPPKQGTSIPSQRDHQPSMTKMCSRNFLKEELAGFPS